MDIFLEILIAYIFADFIGGVYHVLTDRGYNPIKSQVDEFQLHHKNPGEMEFSLVPALFGIPTMFIGFICFPAFFIALGLFGSLTQVTHWYAHKKEIPWVIRVLQKCWVIMPVQHHDDHHSGNFDKNYCILSGWNNWWFNWVIRKFVDRR
jgi:hypothetical protein